MTIRTIRDDRRRQFAGRQRAAMLASLAPDQVRARVRQLAAQGRADVLIASDLGWTVAMVRACLEAAVKDSHA